MADLLARFKLIDEMSQKMSQIASTGTNMLRGWQSAGSEVNSALSSVDKTATGAARAVDEAAKSADALGRATSGVSSSTEAFSDALDNVQESASGAAQQTDYWTDAVGNYDKGALEAIYTTEELVEMGFKTQDALEAEAKAADKATDAAEELGDASEDAGEKQEEMAEKGGNAAKTLADALTAAGVIKLVHEIGKAFMEAAEEAEHFETSVAQLQTIAGAGSIGQLTADINDLSRRTGIAAEDLAGVAYNAISAGAAVEDAVSTAEAASKLATAGFTDTTSALSVLSTAMNSYGEAAGTATDISNSLITVQNLGVTTVADLSQQIGRAIAVASGYNVSLGNLEAAYISTTKAGINTAQSTTYINAMLVELGKAGTDVSEILMEQTGKSFGQLMQSGESLADVLGVLYDSVNGDTEAFMNLWGSSTAGMGAAAIINQGLKQFNDNLQAVENSAGATEQAYAIMADTTEFAHNRMKNSMQQVSIAFGTTLNPALEKVYNGVAKLLNGVASFIEKHPKLVKAVSAIAIGLGVAAVAIVGVTTVVNVLIPAIIGLGTAINAAMGPIGWIAIGIAAVTTAIVAFTAMSEKAEDETLSMTAATRQQYYELQDLQAEYDNACATYGDTSEEASRLRYQLDDLTASFNANRQSVDELCDEVDDIIQKHNDLFDSFDNSTQAVKDEELANLALIAKLSDMAASTDQTAASQAAMNAIIEELNRNLNSASLSYEELMKDQEGSIRTLREYAKAQAEQEMRQAKLEEYVALIKQQAIEEEELAKVKNEVEAATEANTAAQQEYMDALLAATKYDTTGYAGLAVAFMPVGKNAKAAAEELSRVTSAQGDLEASLSETEARIAELEAEWGVLNGTQEQNVQTTRDFKDVLSDALDTVKSDLDELCAAYNSAYESARSSIDGQIGLFDTMKTETTTTVEEMQTALASQLEYLTLYTENLRKAVQYGIDEGLIASLSDGSAESAGYIDAIIKKYEELGAGTDEAKEFVDGFNKSFTDVQKAKDTFADTVAKMETDFDEKMGQIEDRLTTSIEEMDKSNDAAAAAKATIDAYTKAIRDGTDGAAAAARAVSAGVTAALNSAMYSLYYTPTGLPGHAGGTEHAEDAFVAGEQGPELIQRATGEVDAGKPEFFVAGQNGPELIIGEAGAKVYTHEETQKILQSIERGGQGDIISTSYDRTYDTDYAYDMSKAVDNSTEVSNASTSSSNDIISTSYDRTYDTDYMTQIGGQQEAAVWLLPEFLSAIGKYTGLPVETRPAAVSDVLGGAEGDTDDYPADTDGRGGGGGVESNGKTTEDSKHIYLEIAGAGAIDISARTDKAEVLEIIQEHIKPVLVGIIQQEIFEEGDRSYEF